MSCFIPTAKWFHNCAGCHPEIFRNVLYVYRVYCTSLLLLLCLGGVYAQSASPSEYDIKFIQLGDLSASRNIYDVCQDHFGVLWIGSKGGLFRYIGGNMEHYVFRGQDKLFTDEVNSVKEDSAGNLWVATKSGLKILDATRSNLLTLNTLHLPDWLASTHVAITNGPANSLYILSGKQVLLYQQKHLILKYTLPVNDLAFPLILRYSKRDSLLYLYEIYQFNNRFITIDSDGRINVNPYVYVKRSRPLSKHLATNYLIPWTFADSVIFFYYQYKIEYDKPHQYLICHENQLNVNDFSRKQALISQFIKKNLYTLHAGVTITQICHLSNDLDVFMTTEGLFLVKPKKIRFRQIKPSVNKAIRAIQTDCFGRLIYCSNQDLIWQFPNEKTAHLLRQSFVAWKILPTDKSQSRFFLGKDTRTNQWLYIRSSHKEISTFLEKSNILPPTGHLVIASTSACDDTIRQGIWSYIRTDDKYFQLTFYDITGNSHYFLNPVYHFQDPRGMIAAKDLWIGGLSGLKRFRHPNPRSGILTEDSCSIPAVIRNLRILCMYPGTNGNIWLGVEGGGVYWYHPDSGQYGQLSKRNGLPDNSVFCIIGEPGDTVLWLGTGAGLSRFDTGQKQFENFFETDGLPSNEFNTGATALGTDGSIYMGGQNGIVRFHPNSFSTKPNEVLQTVLVRLIGTNSNIDVRECTLINNELLQVTPDVQLLQFTFNTDELLHPEQQQFCYRIRGLIDQWQTLRYDEKALLSRLPYGKHILEVKTQNYRGIWMPPVTYMLDILPPWYATWWFLAIIILLITCILFLLYYLRIQQLRKEFKLRQQISHDLHDELGSRIYLMRTLSHKIANPLLPDAEKQADLKHFEATSQETFKSIRDFIWAFDPRQDKVHQLFDRMDDFAENYLSPIIDTVQIHRSDIPDGLKIGPRVKHHLMNIYQELLTNMVKHTQSEEINIFLSLSGSTLSVEIHNRHKSYRGANPVSSEIQLGQESLHNRLAEINAKLALEEKEAGLQTARISINI